jgi:hypothetical protein
MITWDKLGRQKWQPGPYSSHFSVVLSLVFSLALVSIVSKHHAVNSLWVDGFAFAVPLAIALYFEDRIGRFGVFTCVASIALPLGAAVLFGI